MDGSGKSLQLHEFSKSTPPGWDPHKCEAFPLRAYLDRLRLWGRLTDLRADQVGVAAASRLHGRAYRLAMSMRIDDPRTGQVFVGDDALAFRGYDADPVNGLPAVQSGLNHLVSRLRFGYGAEEQKISTRSIDSFEALVRDERMSLLEYLSEFEFLYNQANELADYSISPVARTHRLLKGARVPKELIDHILLKEDYDKSRFDQIYAHLMKRAKTQEPSQLPARGSSYLGEPSGHTPSTSSYLDSSSADPNSWWDDDWEDPSLHHHGDEYDESYSHWDEWGYGPAYLGQGADWYDEWEYPTWYEPSATDTETPDEYDDYSYGDEWGYSSMPPPSYYGKGKGKFSSFQRQVFQLP